MLDCRAKAVLPERLNGFGQNMGQIMTDQLQRARIIARHQLYRGPIGHGRRQIAQLAINDRGHHAHGEAVADGGREIGGSAGRIKRAGRAIGQANGNHFEVFLSQDEAPGRGRCLPRSCSGQGARASAMFRAAVHVPPAPRRHRRKRWVETGRHDPARATTTADSQAQVGSTASQQGRRSGCG